jgi:hypothetical protein
LPPLLPLLLLLLPPLLLLLLLLLPLKSETSALCQAQLRAAQRATA